MTGHAAAEGTRPPALSIVMPAHDEEDGIERAVRAGLDACDAWCGPSAGEVVVVDDGSRDATGSIVARLVGSDGRVVLVSHPRCRGLGAAVRTGLAAARGDLVLYTDSDLPFDLANVPLVLAPFADDEVDVVAGFRVGPRAEGARRWAYSLGYNALVRATLGIDVRDVNFAAKAFRRRVLDVLELHSEGSFIDAEVLARAQHAGFRVAQVGVAYQPRTRGVSTLSSWPTIAQMLREMRALRPGIVAGRPPSVVGER